MRYDKFTLAVPTSVAAGAAQSTPGCYEQCAVQIWGTFAATLAVEASSDGTNFSAVSSVTAPGWVSIPFAFKAIRINTTAFTSGTPNAALCVHNRSE